jgi:hypothetical protein
VSVLGQTDGCLQQENLIDVTLTPYRSRLLGGGGSIDLGWHPCHNFRPLPLPTRSRISTISEEIQALRAEVDRAAKYFRYAVAFLQR